MTSQRQRAINKELSLLLPAIPYFDSEPIRQAANSPHMRKLPASIALWLTTIAYIRHQYTDYDQLRDDGYDKDCAHFFVFEAINAKLTQWRATRLLSLEEMSESEN